MAGKIEFNIHPFYTNKIKSAFLDPFRNTAGQGAPGILIDIDSIVSIGSEVRSVSLPDITGDPGEPIINEIDARINNVILFLKDVPYNNKPNTTKVQNPFKFVLSTESVVRDWADQYVSGQLKIPNGVDFPCKDAGIFGMINCVNSKFDLLQATIDAIEANPGSGVTPVKVGVDIDTFENVFPEPVTPTPFSFKLFPTPEPPPGMEDPSPGGVEFTPCLDELSAMVAKGILEEAPGAFVNQVFSAIESGNEEQACELLAMLAGA